MRVSIAWTGATARKCHLPGPRVAFAFSTPDKTDFQPAGAIAQNHGDCGMTGMCEE